MRLCAGRHRILALLSGSGMNCDRADTPNIQIDVTTLLFLSRSWYNESYLETIFTSRSSFYIRES